mmetsp:Transcript_26995/g.76248  ORF Transcript_26995/g.76248 Transcript_26995/m.76248 type:complete len:257 (+) Transcript_26995:107-877(+)
MPLLHANLYEVLERLELRVIDQVELLHEIDEVLERVIQMCVGLPLDHLPEVRVEGVRVDPEEPLVDHAHPLAVVGGEGHPGLDRQEGLVGQLLLDPHEELLGVPRRGHLRGRLDLVAVGPGEGVRPGAHHRAGLLRAEIRDGAGEEIQLVEEVDGRHREPLLLVGPVGELHLRFQVPAPKGFLPLQQQRAVARIHGELERRQQRGIPPLLPFFLHARPLHGVCHRTADRGCGVFTHRLQSTRARWRARRCWRCPQH